MSRRTAVVVFSQRGVIRAGAARVADDVRRRAEEAAARATADAVLRGRGDADVVLLRDGEDATGLAGAARHVLRQRGATFEERLLGGLERVAALGYDRVVVVGTDTPEIAAADVAAAIAADDVVVGPALDGGFYLVALATADVPRLRGLPWRTAHVRAELRARFAADLVARVVELAPRADVDDADDVIALLPALDAACRRFLGRALITEPRALPRFDVDAAFLPSTLRPATSPQGPPAAAA